MTKQGKKTSPSIKGYLPIRIALPPLSLLGKDQPSVASFVYIKEHSERSPPKSGAGAGAGGGATLFVANAPANGPVRTDLFLRALFERCGDVERVTATNDLRKIGSSNSSGEEAAEFFRTAALAGLDDCGAFLPRAQRGDGRFAHVIGSNSSGEEAAEFFRNAALAGFDAVPPRAPRGDGKFAHVVFASSKEMKKALKALNKEISKGGDGYAVGLDDDKMERLKRETAELLSDESKESGDDGSDDEGEECEELTGIRATAAQARMKAGRHISRQKLMQMCNEAMASFETEEAEAERKAKLAGEQPDEDGFVTVTHKSAPSFGAANDLEEDRHHRRKAGKRNRKRKGGSGADELTDFYRFQMKETRMREVQDLKKRFEEDLAKVKKMKEERAYRPF
ncbi:hypothetical protein ACHAWF_016841 [Thalassiosira exigua]